jgi:hypothetical protein
MKNLEVAGIFVLLLGNLLFMLAASLLWVPH